MILFKFISKIRKQKENYIATALIFHYFSTIFYKAYRKSDRKTGKISATGQHLLSFYLLRNQAAAKPELHFVSDTLLRDKRQQCKWQ